VADRREKTLVTLANGPRVEASLVRSLLLRPACVLLAVVPLAVSFPAHGEVIEEIVAWVNGDIITRSEYETEEQLALGDVYRQFTGAELDKQVADVRSRLLLSMIDNKILVDHAERLYPVAQMAESFYEDFKQQENITDDQELERLLARSGMTIADLKRRLVERYAPDYVIRFEVGNKLGVSETEIQAFYEESIEEFVVPAEATLREIVLLAATTEDKEERRAEAEAIRARVVGGEDFATVAEEVSESGSSTSGGLLGAMQDKDLSDILLLPAFEVPVGEVSPVLEAPYGFHIIKVDARTEQEIMPFEDVRDRISTFLADQKFTTEMQVFLQRARTDSQWCVKDKYKELIPFNPPTSCGSL